MNSKAMATLLVIGLACGTTSLRGQTPAERTWTDDQGRKVQAVFGGVRGNDVLLKLSNGQTVPFAIARLSPVDQDFVKTQSSTPSGNAANGGTTAASPARPPLDKRTFPDKIEVSARTIEANPVSEKPEERQFIYQTESFEFSSQAKLARSVMTEVAQTFEATRELVSKLPWGIECLPPEGLERYQAKLFETRADYLAAGAPQLSGGVYNGGLKVFMVPFESIGLKKTGKTYYMDRKNFRSDTLVHEITHQVMDEYIRFLPTWVTEGTAEYTELLPDSASGFLASQHERGLKEYIESFEKRGIAAEIPSLQDHMMMDRDKWDGIAINPTAMATLYVRSCLVVYYFNHLDGDGKGSRFMRFMDAVHGEVVHTREFFKNPAVKREGSSFTYPRSLTPPDFNNPFKHLDKLLDERSYEAIAKEMVEKYKQKGIKLRVS